MLLLVAREPRSRFEDGLEGKPTRTRIVHSNVSGLGRPQFLDEVDFGAFGKLAETPLMEPRVDRAGAIVSWLALNPRRRSESREASQQRCAAAMTTCFKTWRTLSLFDKSLRLPHGDVVMHVVEEPTTIPGNPPAAVMERWIGSINRHPQARGFYMEPVFEKPEDAGARALTPDELSKTIALQWESIWANVNRYGWAIRFHAEAQGRCSAMLQRINAWIDERERRKRQALTKEIQRGETRRARALRQERIVPRDEVSQLLSRLGARSQFSEDEALTSLSRREFTTALMLGMVAIPMGRYWRYDPVLTIQLPGESIHRLVGHWDSWKVPIDGKLQLATFIHV